MFDQWTYRIEQVKRLTERRHHRRRRRDEVKRLLVSRLKLRLVGQDKYIAGHASSLVYDNADEGRLDEILECFQVAVEKRRPTIRDFYYWYKDHPMSAMDCYVWRIYAAAADEMYNVKASPGRFSGRGDNLVERIRTWLGADAGNDLQATLIDYFSFIFLKVHRSNPSMIRSAKVLLGELGWEMFMEAVADRGGRQSYVVPSKTVVSREAGLRQQLAQIQQVRDSALERGDLSWYDEIGRLLGHRDVDSVYREVVK